MNEVEKKIHQRLDFVEANLLSILNQIEETEPEIVEKCLMKPELILKRSIYGFD